MESSHFIGVDFSALIGKHKRGDLTYWITGQYLTDAKGKSGFVITDVQVSGERKKVIIDI